MNTSILKYVCVFFSLVSIASYAQTLKLMTYNIRLDIASDAENDWSHRKDFLTSQIQFYEPDIYGVQEAKPNQVIDIATTLSQYSYVGTGRDGVGKGESSNIFYKKEKFKVLQSNTFWLSKTPDTISIGWDAACNRVCTYALFKNNSSKKLFWVFNTHLDHMGEEARTNGILLILSRIKELNTKNYPVIFMGDFNSEPNTERIIALKETMNDAREITIEKPFGPSGTFNGFNYNEPNPKLIDYIFISKNDKITVLKYAVLTDAKELRYPSDHFPVVVEISYK
jgi:endonuclease/exonuclease/phosphatase family metal-dependent hydrolase